MGKSLFVGREIPTLFFKLRSHIYIEKNTRKLTFEERTNTQGEFRHPPKRIKKSVKANHLIRQGEFGKRSRAF